MLPSRSDGQTPGHHPASCSLWLGLIVAVSSRAFVFLSCILRYDRVTYRQIRPDLTMSLPLCFINSSFYNQPGKWACKNEFKDLQCRIMFPQCSDNSDLGTNKAPCKKTCVDFSSRCPGADVSCDALSDDPNSCYDYDYAATTGNVQGGGLSGWPSVIICLVVLGAMVGIAKISKSMSPKKSFQAMNINSAANV